MKHTTVKLKKEVDVDEDIAPLIQLLWDSEIETCFSCQGDSRRKAQISFNSERDFLRFMNNILDFDPSLRKLTMPWHSTRHGWDISLGFFNEKKSIKYSKIVIHLFFPKEDILWLTNVWKQIKQGEKSSFGDIDFPKEMKYNLSEQIQFIRKIAIERYS